MLGFSHPIRKKIKTSHPHGGDRYIPDRPTPDEFDLVSSDRPPSSATPFSDYLYSSLFDMTRTEYNNRRLFSYTGLNTAQQLNTTHLFTPNARETKKHRSQHKTTLETGRILDAPGIPLDFYLNLLSFSKGGRLTTAVESEETDSFNIASLFIAEDTRQEKLMLFDPINEQPCSIAASEDDAVITGWSDGVLRRYCFDGRTAPAQQIDIIRDQQINAVAVTSPHTCLIGTDHGLMGLIDFRTPERTNIATHMDGQRASRSYQIAGLAFNGAHYFATGANDNLVKVWDLRQFHTSLYTNRMHTAGVKALAFDPKSHVNLISGGGTACCKLYLSNITTQETRPLVNTGAQITGVHWFEDDPRYLVTSHGYPQGSIKLWRKKGGELTLDDEVKSSDKTTTRILYLAGSSRKNQIAVVEDNESIRFFKPIGVKSDVKKKASDALYPAMLPGGPTIR